MAVKLSACVFPILIVFSYLEVQLIFAEHYDASSLPIETIVRKGEKLDNPIIITGTPQTIANVSLRLGEESIVHIVIDQNQHVSFGFDVTAGELNVWLSDSANVSRNEWHFDVVAVNIYNKIIDPFGNSRSFDMFVHINAIGGSASTPSNIARIGAALGEQEIYKDNHSTTRTTGGSTKTTTSAIASTTDGSGTTDNPIVITSTPQTIATVNLRFGETRVVQIIIDQNQHVSFGFDVTSGELNVWLSDSANVSRNEWHFDVAAVHIYNKFINPFGSIKTFTMLVHIDAIGGNASFPSNTARIGAALGEKDVYKDDHSSTSTTGDSTTTTKRTTTRKTDGTTTRTTRITSTTRDSTTEDSTNTNIKIFGITFSVGGFIGTAGGASAVSVVFLFCCCCFCCRKNPFRCCCPAETEKQTETYSSVRYLEPTPTITVNNRSSQLSSTPLSVDYNEGQTELKGNINSSAKWN